MVCILLLILKWSSILIYMKTNSWSHINTVIPYLDKLIHDHLRLRKHEYLSWTLMGKVVRTFNSLKTNVLLPFYVTCWTFNWKIRFELFKTFLMIMWCYRLPKYISRILFESKIVFQMGDANRHFNRFSFYFVFGHLDFF